MPMTHAVVSWPESLSCQSIKSATACAPHLPRRHRQSSAGHGKTRLMSLVGASTTSNEEAEFVASEMYSNSRVGAARCRSQSLTPRFRFGGIFRQMDRGRAATSVTRRSTSPGHFDWCRLTRRTRHGRPRGRYRLYMRGQEYQCDKALGHSKPFVVPRSYDCRHAAWDILHELYYLPDMPVVYPPRYLHVRQLCSSRRLYVSRIDAPMIDSASMSMRLFRVVALLCCNTVTARLHLNIRRCGDDDTARQTRTARPLYCT